MDWQGGSDVNGLKSAGGHNPPAFLNVPFIVKLSLAVLIAIHFLIWLLGPQNEMWAYYYFAFIPARFSAEAQISQVPGSAYWSMLTYSFLHGDLTHLIFNALWLLVFGTPVARRLPPWRFTLIAAAGSIGGALASLVTHWSETVILIGASAAISALMAAAVPIMFGRGSLLRRTGTPERAQAAHVLSISELLQNRSALMFIAVFLGLTLVTGAAQMIGGAALLEERAIAWEAHFGGFLAGLATFYAVDNREVHGAS